MRKYLKFQDKSGYQYSSGFTMMEVLIAMLIMSVGLLGLATMQVVGMKNNHSAYLRTQATSLANEYIDLLRSNTTEVSNNKFGTVADDGNEFSSITSKLNDVALSRTATCTTNEGCTTPPPPPCGCTPAQWAETDLLTWIARLRQLLPAAVATSNRVGNTYTLSIFWLDDRNDSDKNSDGSNKGTDVNGDGDDTDDIDADSSGSTDGNESQYKVFITRFQL